jgi:hypothetical protein
MKKSLSVAAATLLLALATTPAFAGHAGQMGLGLLSTSTPVGVFFGINDQTMVHFGLGFEKPDTDEADNGELTSQFSIAGALEYDLWSGDNWGFGVFPGVAFSSASFEDVGTVSVDSASEIALALNLGGHVDLASNVSVYFVHGLDISIVDSGAGDSATNIGTSGSDLGEFGVNFWIK